jgi:hypothetical protein
VRRSNIWLSVDWDYFVREDEAWDFGHAETPDFRSHLWDIRVAQFLAVGRDLIEETSLEQAEPSPRDFWRRLQGLGYDFRKVKTIVVGDSHQWAYDVFKRSVLAGPPLSQTRIVHFDAHHDLTYDIRRFEREACEERITCENWLLMTHLCQYRLRSLIVYPPWKGLRDWEQSFPKKFSELREALKRYTEPCVWPDPLISEAAGEVELVYICRSGAWTPPWHDQAFIRFVRNLQKLTGVPVTTPFIDQEQLDPLTPRVFNLEHAKQIVDTEKSFMARLSSQACADDDLIEWIENA